jgi:hypothetical protein
VGLAGMAARVIEMRDGAIESDRRRKPLPAQPPSLGGAPA